MRPESPSDEQSVWTVTDLLAEVGAVLDETFRRVVVAGEISGFRQHGSGHCYFLLKDDESQIRTVLWRSTARRLSMAPRDGMQVEIRGRVEMYAARGDTQLIVDAMRPAGDGTAQAALEALKQKLHKEGLFSQSAKQPLPIRPRCIGLVTSGSGAALHDITSILARRYPVVRAVIRPVSVQGADAPLDIATAINEFNEAVAMGRIDVDVLIVGRGGGSAEDLWAFNEEVVARAIFDSRIPVVSAVGHEVDITIADLVADRRAATPSMAAELVVPDQAEIRKQLETTARWFATHAANRLNYLRQRVDHLTGSYHFRRTVDRLNQMRTDVCRHVDGAERALKGVLVDDRRRAALLRGRVGPAIARSLERRRILAHSIQRRLMSADPKRPLSRGFALVQKEGRVVTSSAHLATGERVSLTFNDGTRQADISEEAAGAAPETDS